MCQGHATFECVCVCVPGTGAGGFTRTPRKNPSCSSWAGCNGRGPWGWAKKTHLGHICGSLVGVALPCLYHLSLRFRFPFYCRFFSWHSPSSDICKFFRGFWKPPMKFNLIRLCTEMSFAPAILSFRANRELNKKFCVFMHDSGISSNSKQLPAVQELTTNCPLPPAPWRWPLPSSDASAFSVTASPVGNFH